MTLKVSTASATVAYRLQRVFPSDARLFVCELIHKFWRFRLQLAKLCKYFGAETIMRCGTVCTGLKLKWSLPSLEKVRGQLPSFPRGSALHASNQVVVQTTD